MGIYDLFYVGIYAAYASMAIGGIAAFFILRD